VTPFFIQITSIFGYMKIRPLFIAGSWIETESTISVINPWDGELIGMVSQADRSHLEMAVVAAEQSRNACRKMPSWKRWEVLQHIVRRLAERKEEFAQMICAEAGKPILFARAEVDRAITTFSLAADSVRNSKGEVIPLDLNQSSEGKMGIVRSFPVGIVLAISPFNFPLNLVAHKVAPAIASGNAVIHKPASKTPITALMLAEIIAETNWPVGGYSVLPCPGKVGQQLVSDARIQMLSFTGSPEVGWALKAIAGKKKVALELGGDAAAIIAESADIKIAARKCALGAFVYAGQVCISIQRIFVVKKIFASFKDEFLATTRSLQCGDPMIPEMVVGPMIDDENRVRVLEWIAEAQSAGAQLLNGPVRVNGNVISPVVLSGINNQCRLGTTEAFAPIVWLESVDDVKAAIDRVNASQYGLQAALFTDSQSEIRQAFEELEVGGVTINESPTFRSDNMPYGGVKESGLGREGIEYAIQEMTERKIMVW
jgi:acyl-CoA reductase-like NAD-dependent aldehyde dehydrogenase